MSTANTPNKYQPSERLIDNPQRLRALYCSRGLTIEQIVDEYAEVGKSRVGQKLKEYGLTECNCNNSSDGTRSGNRGSDPPESKIQQDRSSAKTDSDPPTVDWSDTV